MPFLKIFVVNAYYDCCLNFDFLGNSFSQFIEFNFHRIGLFWLKIPIDATIEAIKFIARHICMLKKSAATVYEKIQKKSKLPK